MTETEALLFERFHRVTLGIEEVAEVLGEAVETLYSKRSRRALPVPMWREGRGLRAHLADVAAYVDQRRESARQALERGR